MHFSATDQQDWFILPNPIDIQFVAWNEACVAHSTIAVSWTTVFVAHDTVVGMRCPEHANDVKNSFTRNMVNVN